MTQEQVSFRHLVDLVNKSSNYLKILTQQLNNYEIRSYKLEKDRPEDMLKLYEKLEIKFNQKQHKESQMNVWNQNQRRLYVWYIVTFSYFYPINITQNNDKLWLNLSNIFFLKNPEFLHFQYLNLIRFLKRAPWSEVEDQLLKKLVNKVQNSKWNQISKKLFFESNRQIFRNPKHCRQRWLNHLDQNKTHGQWTTEEDFTILEFVLENGKKWSKIGPLLKDRRTEHMIKNRYNSIVTKNLHSKKYRQEDVLRKVIQNLQKTLQKKSGKKQEVKKSRFRLKKIVEKDEQWEQEEKRPQIIKEKEIKSESEKCKIEFKDNNTEKVEISQTGYPFLQHMTSPAYLDPFPEANSILDMNLHQLIQQQQPALYHPFYNSYGVFNIPYPLI